MRTLNNITLRYIRFDYITRRRDPRQCLPNTQCVRQLCSRLFETIVWVQLLHPFETAPLNTCMLQFVRVHGWRNEMCMRKRNLLHNTKG